MLRIGASSITAKEGAVEARAEWRAAVDVNSRNARPQNQIAWTMLVGSNEIRNSPEALLAASAAVAEEPFVSQYLNSLGIEQYRATKVG